jgi:hypothetical protein
LSDAGRNDILTRVREAARANILFLPHALDRMNACDPMISAQEVAHVVLSGEVIEDYPEDVRGHSCLMLGDGHDARPVHVVCSPKDSFLAIITVYLPDEHHWESNWRTRKER